MIVVDTNVLAYLWLPCAEAPLAEALLAKDAEWVAPLLWRSEFCNVLVGYVGRRVLSAADARHILGEVETQMRGREYAVSSEAVLSTAISSPCSAYDCEFVVLARELRLPLVTADRQVVTAFPSVARSFATYARS